MSGARAVGLRDLTATIREDLAVHEGDWTLPGFRALALHRFGVWRLGVSPRALRAPLTLLYRMAYVRIRNRYGIELPYSATVGRRVRIEHQGSIVVHGASAIGDDVIIRQGVTLGNRHLDDPGAAPVIGNRVNIGANAVVLGRIRIGDDAKIGAGAIVLDDVPNGAVVIGPRATIRRLDD